MKDGGGVNSVGCVRGASELVSVSVSNSDVTVYAEDSPVSPFSDGTGSITSTGWSGIVCTSPRFWLR